MDDYILELEYSVYRQRIIDRVLDEDLILLVKEDLGWINYDYHSKAEGILKIVKKYLKENVENIAWN